MRTTVDLPDDLIRAAKTRAAERGEKLKDLFVRAVMHEVGRPADRTADRPGRVTLPLVGADAEPTVNLSNADLAAILDQDDADKYGSQ